MNTAAPLGWPSSHEASPFLSLSLSLFLSLSGRPTAGTLDASAKRPLAEANAKEQKFRRKNKILEFVQKIYRFVKNTDLLSRLISGAVRSVCRVGQIGLVIDVNAKSALLLGACAGDVMENLKREIYSFKSKM